MAVFRPVQSPRPTVAVGTLCCAGLLASISGVAHATDTWTNVATGVDYLHRVESGSVPQDIHVAKVDLTNPLISLHAADDLSGERGVNTRTFATSSGSIVAINGDWGNTTSTPISLAMGDGNMWNSHFTDPSVGAEWGFFACDIFNRCESSTRPPGDLGFLYPLLAPYRFFNAVGANGLVLVEDGTRGVGCYDTVRNPRSGICVDSTRETLYLMAVDGRSSTASGMTCDEMRDLALDLGCYDAAMLDGGGSTTLVVDGSVMNTPSDGSLRSRPNHFGVILATSADTECASTPSRRWCDGTEVNTCSGGRYLGAGDCAFFGATCEEDGDWAYCVHPSCPDGDGQGSECLGATEIRTCTDGWLSDGDCAAFGLPCGEDAGGAACMDPRCTSGPNSGFCIDALTAAQCSEGGYAETACEGDATCVVSGMEATCQEPEPVDTSDSGAADGGTGGEDGSDGSGSGSGGTGTGDGASDGGTGETDTETSEADEETSGEGGGDKGGCASVGLGGLSGLGWMAGFLVAAGRRRGSLAGGSRRA